MTLMLAEVYDALRSILSEAEARKHAIVFSRPQASYASIAWIFHSVGVSNELAERAANAMIENHACQGGLDKTVRSPRRR